ncbi:FecR family protein [Pseudomonas sp. TH31]|uniref:FecR family protein n=1 Tax=Pseudomonas sp. TH31 TaxID=2796396 RepID=UPI00191332AE|nr:FecR domain-containing protein [Pseudomonas sp. TH31]MBK5416177.1 FecR domain-containing protein [Pseudomonas sp. TH31]
MRNTVIFNLSLCLGLANILTHAQALADPAGQVHVVKKGETLWDIAGQYLQNPTDWTQIQKLNALGTPQSLQVGTELNIPLLDNAFPVKVLHLQGQAWLIVKGQTERPLAQGMKLDVGQRVRTGEASFVTLGFGDGTKTVLPPLSLVTLSLGQQYETPQILLHQGEVESYVPKQATPGNSFEVITPQGVLGVRGTHFRVRIDTPHKSLVEVLGGRVVASSTQTTHRPETSISPNQGLVLSDKGALRVSTLLPATQSAERAQASPDNPDWQIRAHPILGATKYLAQVSHTADFLSIEQDQLSARPEFNFKGLKDAFYYVSIVAIDTQGLRGEPAQFLLLYRAANGGVDVQQNDQVYLFNWAAAPSVPCMRYRLKVSSNVDFSSPLIDQRGIQSTAVNIKGLPPGLLYWQVSTDQDQQPSIIGSGTLR